MILFTYYWFQFAKILCKSFVLLFIREIGVRFSFFVMSLGLVLG